MPGLAFLGEIVLFGFFSSNKMMQEINELVTEFSCFFVVTLSKTRRVTAKAVKYVLINLSPQLVDSQEMN